MEGLYKRARLDDFLNVGRDVAFAILTQVEVRDALNLRMAVAKDARFTSFRSVMDSEEIWMFWVKRDLAIIATAFDDFQKLAFPVDDRPQWKTRYFWYRLFVSALQWNVVRKPEFADESIYSYEYLNVVRVNGRLVDFRPLFVDYLDRVLVTETERRRRSYNLYFFQVDFIGYIDYRAFVDQNLQLPAVAAHTYERILKEFDRLIDYKPEPDQPIPRNILAYLAAFRDEVRTFPRELEERRILVTAQCPTCGKVYSIKNT